MLHAGVPGFAVTTLRRRIRSKLNRLLITLVDISIDTVLVMALLASLWFLSKMLHAGSFSHTFTELFESIHEKTFLANFTLLASKGALRIWRS